jgi:hypothetical protein
MNAPISIANALAVDTRAACFLAVSAICRNFCCEFVQLNDALGLSATA